MKSRQASAASTSTSALATLQSLSCGGRHQPLPGHPLGRSATEDAPLGNTYPPLIQTKVKVSRALALAGLLPARLAIGVGADGRSWTFPSQAAAKAWRADALAAANRGKLRAPSTITVEQAAAEWLAGARAGAIPNRKGDRYKPSASTRRRGSRSAG